MAQKVKENISEMNVYEKLNKIKEEIRSHQFTMDCVLPTNLGSGEYASIGQYYSLLQEKTIKYNMFFKWDVMEELDFEKNVFQVSGKLPQHLSTVSCIATFINLDNTEEVVEIMTIASGSDSLDKGVSGASTLAFRNFFDKNFTPNYLNLGGETEISNNEIKTEEPKIPTYIPQEKKEELTKKVVAEEQHEESDKEDVTRIVGKIMKVREKLGNDTWGNATLDGLVENKFTSADLVSIELKIDNKLDSIGGEE